MRTVLITGSSGFIGFNLCNYLSQFKNEFKIYGVDKRLPLTNSPSSAINFHYYKCDLVDEQNIGDLVNQLSPEIIVHLAADSHVDTSINYPNEVCKNNVLGFINILGAFRHQYNKFSKIEQSESLFLNISTDEIFGSTSGDEHFCAETKINPSSPYSSSKAACDLIGNSFAKTFGLPILNSVSVNNFGPLQHPEKFIPNLIFRSINNIPFEIYGDGLQMRTWLPVIDHCRHIKTVIQRKIIDSPIFIGSDVCCTNLEIAKRVHEIVLQKTIKLGNLNVSNKMRANFAKDRPAHDHCYRVNYQESIVKTGFTPSEDVWDYLDYTVNWYLKNPWYFDYVCSNGWNIQRKGLIND